MVFDLFDLLQGDHIRNDLFDDQFVFDQVGLFSDWVDFSSRD